MTVETNITAAPAVAAIVAWGVAAEFAPKPVFGKNGYRLERPDYEEQDELHESAVTWDFEGDMPTTSFVTPYLDRDENREDAYISRADMLRRLGLADAELPVLENVEVGSTGYLDTVLEEDVTAPIMIGQDKHGRAFMTFRITDGERVWVETLFERYVEGSRWTTGTAYGGRDIICSSLMHSVQVAALRNLIASTEDSPAPALHCLGCRRKGGSRRLKTDADYDQWEDVFIGVGEFWLV